MSRISFF